MWGFLYNLCVSLSLLLSLLVVVVNLFLGIFTLSKGSKNRLDRVFFGLLTASISIGVLASIMLLQFPDVFWGRLVNAFGGLTGTLLVLLTYALEEKTRINLHKVPLTLLSLLPFLLAALAFSPLAIKGTVLVDGFLRPEPGSLYSATQAIIICLILWGVARLISIYRRATGLLRTQIQYFILGFVICAAVSIIMNLILPRFGVVAFTAFTPASLILLTAPTTYALIRYRLFDIRIALQTGVIVLVLALVSPFVYLFISQVFGQIFTGRPAYLTPIAAILTLTLLVLASVQTIRTVQRYTERIFFRGTYLYGETLSKITAILNRATSVEDFGTKLTRTIAETFKTKRAVFLLRDEKKDSFAPVYIQTLPNHGAFTFAKNNAIVQLMEKSDGPLLTEEAAERTSSTTQVENLKRNGVALCLPIKVRGKMEALLCLGEKSSGNPYTTRDTSLLEVVSREAGVALENARLYTSLEEKVAERTQKLREIQRKEMGRLREIAKLKDEFFFIATHELRAPTTAINGFLKLVSSSKEGVSKDMEENLSSIEMASHHLNQLVNDLLEISRSESGTMVFKVSEHNLTTTLNEVLEELDSKAKQKRIQTHSRLPAQQNVLCDPEKLKEVLTNLVDNAIKYNRDGGSIDVSSYPLPDGKNLMIEVEDTGYGIPKEEQGKLFQKFFRAQSKETQDVLGTGLGLFITRMLVEKMGGKIGFESQEGRGTTFHFTLPLSKNKSR